MLIQYKVRWKKMFIAKSNISAHNSHDILNIYIGSS